MDTLLMGDWFRGPGHSDEEVAIVRRGGEIACVSSAYLAQLMQSHADLRHALDASAKHTLRQAQSIAACAQHHPIIPRLATFLLRLSLGDADQPLDISQEALSEALGVQRTTVNGAARLLKLNRLISYQRGRIWLRDLEGLARLSCSCRHSIPGR